MTNRNFKINPLRNVLSMIDNTFRKEIDNFTESQTFIVQQPLSEYNMNMSEYCKSLNIFSKNSISLTWWWVLALVIPHNNNLA